MTSRKVDKKKKSKSVKTSKFKPNYPVKPFKTVTLRSSPIHNWMKLVKRSWVTVGDEKKGVFQTKCGEMARTREFLPPAEDTSLVTPFISVNQVYKFRLADVVDVNSSSGVINSWFPTDPSGSGEAFSEWSTLTSLFSEFRLCEFSVQITNSSWNLGGGVYGSTVVAPPVLIVGSDLAVSGAPGSFAAVADNADSVLVNVPRMTSNRGYTHVLKGTGLNWSSVSSPTTAPYAGAPGSIQVYGSFGSTTQSACLRCLVTGFYEFRSRG